MTAIADIPGLLSRVALTGVQRDEMFALLSRHFEGVTREQFDRDLAEKNWVVEIRRDDRLLGFSTLLVSEVRWEGSVITAIYSGDTIVAPEAWGSPLLARTWIAAVNFLRAASPGRRCFWLLLTSGFRTYRFLPVFWRDFYPRHDTPTPPSTQRMLQHLAHSCYGTAFDAVAGLVRFPHPQRLRAIPADRATDPHVAFFLRSNPGHAAGDELVCVTEISGANLTAAGRRVVGGNR
ncbi:MAG: hypothetical protein ABI680_13400 [Chthoniobacteraceae bacterium]